MFFSSGKFELEENIVREDLYVLISSEVSIKLVHRKQFSNLYKGVKIILEGGLR